VVTYNENGVYIVSLTATKQLWNNGFQKQNILPVGTTSRKYEDCTKHRYFQIRSEHAHIHIYQTMHGNISVVSGKIVFREKNTANAILSGLPKGSTLLKW
jgi:hypothetical protein